MEKVVVVYGVTAFALFTILIFSGGGGKHRQQHQGGELLHRRGGPGKRIVVKYNSSRISFDPIVANMEQRHDDRDWEKEYLRNKTVSHPDVDYGFNHYNSSSSDLSEWEDMQKLQYEHEEEEEDDYLNDEEKFNISHRLITLFPLVDVNPHDGFITLSELEEWHMSLAYSRLMHRSEREMESHDTNKDGLITLKEYLIHLSDEQLASNNTEHGEPGWWREQFNCADENGDGHLNLTEFHNFLHPEDSKNEKLLKWLCKERIRERDTDKDEKISFSEFEHGMYELLKNQYEFENDNGEHNETTPQQSFSELDKNKDGFLTEDEIKPVLHKLYPGETSYAKYQSSYLMNQADENKDGKLTLDEMLANPYTFYNTAYDDDDDDEDDYTHDEFR